MVNGVPNGQPPRPLPPDTYPFVEWVTSEHAVSGAAGGAYDMAIAGGIMHNTRMSISVCVQCRTPMPRGHVCARWKRVNVRAHWRMH